MVNAHIYIATTFPETDKRLLITELDLANQILEGELDFTGLNFPNLEKIKLQNNQLTKLILTNPHKITSLDISGNKITDLQFAGGYAENFAKRMSYCDFKNNSLPEEYKKALLKSRWEYWKDVEVFYPDKLVPNIMKVVNIGDLDNFIDNYDSSKIGTLEYNNYLNNLTLDEYGFQYLNQQVLGRALIAQNRLVQGEDKEYETKINALAKTFQKFGDMTSKHDLKLIQRELERTLKNEKDWGREFQDQLSELQTLIIGGSDVAVDVPRVKTKIHELQETNQFQKSQITQLLQTLKSKEEERQKLEEKYDATDTALIKAEQEVQQLKDQLDVIQSNERLSKEKIQELETTAVSRESSLKGEFNKLLEEKNSIIKHLQMEITKLQQKPVMQDAETQTPDPFNYWKWGSITLVGGGVVFGIYYFRGIFFKR